MFRPSATVAFAIALALPAFTAGQQKADSDTQEKHLDIRSSKGDLHLGNDADARKAGLPLYPGARPKHDDHDRDSVNVGISGEKFGLKFVVANYDSDDSPSKIVEYYRAKLSKYGRVLECHSHDHDGNPDVDVDNDENRARKLKCEGDNTGPVTELKVGTENNQHLVAVEPRGSGSGSTFALVYVHMRKEGEI
jgi:hypothetical protein